MKEISKSILRLAIPNAVANITVPLLGLVDTAIAGKVAGDVGIGAIALGGAVFNLLYWNCSFLRMATSGLVGQAYGRSDWALCKKLLKRGVLLAAIISTLILVFKEAITDIAVNILSSDETFRLTDAAARYVAIRIWAAPAVLSGYAMQGWMVGMQRSKLPMAVAISTNILNILFSYLFAMKMQMGIDGIAMGTVVAQYLGLGIWVVGGMMDKSLREYIKRGKGESGEEVSYWSFMGKNIDILLRTMVIVGVHFGITILSAKIGETAIACTACLMQFFLLFSYLSDALAYAAEALTGKYIGSRSKVELQEMKKLLFVWCSVLAIGYCAVYMIWWGDILALMGASGEVVQYAREYMPLVILITALSFVSFIADGIMLGASNTRAMFTTMWGAGIMCAISVWGLWSWDAQWALWIGFGVFMVMRGILLLPAIKKVGA